MRGRRPRATALKLLDGSLDPRSAREVTPPRTRPSCPAHLTPTAKTEWKRLATVLHDLGLLTQIDRTVLAAYCQAYGRWVEAERRLAETPPLLKTPAGYVQMSPWIAISNKQVELMVRLMAELGLTPSARSRLSITIPAHKKPWEV